MENQSKQGFLHSRLFKVLCGLMVIALVLVLYNCIVNVEDDSPEAVEQKEAEEQHEALLDTFDVVGDYLFPKQQTSKEDMMTDDEKNGSKEEKNKKSETESRPAQQATTSAEEEIVESADISSDPTPAPEAPKVEPLETPTVTPIE